MRILKFGGSSVADPESILKVAGIIRKKAAGKEEISVVVSALSGITNQLVEICNNIPLDKERCESSLRDLELRHLSIARELIPVSGQPEILAEIMALFNRLNEIAKGASLIGEVTARTRDLILSFGEQLSAYLLYQIIKLDTEEANYSDARLFIKTDTNYGHARVDFEITNRLVKEYFLENRGINVVTGFIASTPEGQTTTLGRNGSDYTASILGAALNAETIEIWSDTDGVMTADPQYVREAQNIGQLTYNEAMELSHFGAKIIFPASLQPAMAKQIPVLVKNTFNPEHKGTIIFHQSVNENGFIKGITSLRNVCLINVEGSGMVGVAGIAARMFNALSVNNISVILISQASSEHSICVSLMQDDGERATAVLKAIFSEELDAGLISSVSYESQLAIVAVVGENMRNMPGVASRVFDPLGRNGINIKAISQGSSELNISFVIHENDLKKALRTLHQALFRNETRQLNLFIAGTGIVGSRLLNMIHEHVEYLIRQKIDLRLCGLINRRKMISGENIISTGDWKSEIEDNSKKADLSRFVDEMLFRNLENSVFIDVTGSPEPVEFYTNLLSSNISIVAANKIANSGSLLKYRELHEAAMKRKVSFHYETNVGAGLPVISVIRKIIAGGDKVIRIEGILSGTLNWLLSEYDGTISFSELVREAKRNGFTEPDPRDDLNGTDVARKCLIIARECGLDIEFENIDVETLIPPDISMSDTLSGFFHELGRNERWFYEKFAKASDAGKKLRYMTSIENGSVSVGLREVDESHPFFSLKGTENCIVLTTKYYLEYPLVIRGPGAGAEVTAAGLLADIVRIAEGIRM